MRAKAEGLGDALFQLGLDLLGRLALGEAGAVADAQDMRVHREGFLPEPAIEHDIGGLAAHTGQADEILARVGHLAVILVDQQLAERDHVLGLGVEQADGLDVLLQPLFAQFEHLPGRFDCSEERARGLVDADIGRLRRQRHGHHQLVGIAIFQLGLGRGIVLRQSAEKLEYLVFGHSCWRLIPGLRLPFPRARGPSLRGGVAWRR